MKTNGATLFMETLIDEGVKCLFGNPGTTELPLMDALVNEDRLQYYLCLHESVAVAAAEGYAFATGNVGIVNVHVAPGLGNAMGNLYNAKRAGSPLVITAGNQGQPGHFHEIILWDDLPRIAEPLTKWAYEVRDVGDLEHAVRRAIKVALTPPTGPVFLSLPGDVLQTSTGGITGSPTRISTRFPAAAEAIERAVKLLSEAKNPILVTGQGIARSGAQDELTEIAEFLGAKVYGECASNAFSFPVTHPQFAGDLPRLAGKMREILEDADVVFFIGSEPLVLSFPPDVKTIPEHIRAIHLDLDAWEIGKSYPAEVALYGDPKTTLPLMSVILQQTWSEADRSKAQERRARVETENQKFWKAVEPVFKSGERDKAGMSRTAFQSAMREALPEGAAFVDESLTTGGNGLRRAIGGKVNDLFGMKGGGIGMGLPTALGVKAATPDRPVVCVSGDGSAMYTIQTLWTAARYGLNAIWIIANNRSYRILKERILNLDGKANEFRQFPAMDFNDPRLDFPAMAGSMGMGSTSVETPNQLIDAVRAALASGKPWLIDAAIDLEPLER
jgi:benzoylformate decarboxylase